MEDKDIIKIAKEVNELHIEDDAFFSLMIRFAHRIIAAEREGSEPVAWIWESEEMKKKNRHWAEIHPTITRPSFSANWKQTTPLYTRPSPIPEGMVLVPKEPTEARLKAGLDMYHAAGNWKAIYCAMIDTTTEGKS